MTVDTFGILAPKLAANGYEPVPIIPGQKRPRPADWQHGGFAGRTAEFHRDFTGILTADCPAVDIDISDENLVRQVEQIVLDVLGCHPPPARIGMAPRRLLMFRTEEPFAKVSTGEYELPSDPVVDGKKKRSRVEILATGQQFVAYAIHPDTHKPYTWNGGGDPLALPRSALPVLDEKQAAEIVRRADALLAQAAGQEPQGDGNLHRMFGKGFNAAEHEKELAADDPALLRQALAAIPNNDIHFDDWIVVCYATKGALGDDGLSDFLAWSAKSSKHDEAFATKQFTSAKPRERGAGTIYWLAEQHGWKREKSVEDQWPEPRPVVAELPPAPAFDAKVLLPEALAKYVLDEADRMPCPPDYVAASLMVALGSVIGSRCALKPKKRDDWVCTPNLFGGAVGDPSTKKSPGIDKGLRFLDRLEADEADRLAQRKVEYEAEVAAHEARQAAIAAIMKSAAGGKKKSEDEVAMAAAVDDLKRLQPPEEPHARRFRTNDTTVEKLGDILAHCSDGILVFRDELVGLLSTWEKEGREGDRAFYLEGWNGLGSFAIDRVGRGSLLVRTLNLSVFGGVQPDLLARYLSNIVDAADNDGRIQRFQMLVYPEPVEWEWRDREPERGVREKVRDTFLRLASFDPVQDGATPADDFAKVPHFGFDDAAQALFIEWSGALHKNLIVAEEAPLLRQHFAKFEKLFCAVSLILHLAEGRIGPVQADTALRAAAWCEYLAGHARRVYGLLEVAKVGSAQTLAKRIAAGKLADHFTARDVLRKGWSGLDTMRQVEAALALLEEFGHIVGFEQEDGPGRPTTRYAINPKSRRKS